MHNTKTCPKCNIEKSVQSYSKNKYAHDNLQSYCKDCCKLYKLSPEALQRKRVKHQEWKKANRNKTREYDRELLTQWRKDNPEKAAEHAVTRRARKLKATPSWLNKDDRKKIAEICNLRDQLELETGLKHHVDHIVPLQGEDVCGLHVPWNLRVITAEENCSKKNKLIVDLGIDTSAAVYN
jgi:hypothetical protein